MRMIFPFRKLGDGEIGRHGDGEKDRKIKDGEKSFLLFPRHRVTPSPFPLVSFPRVPVLFRLINVKFLYLLLKSNYF